MYGVWTIVLLFHTNGNILLVSTKKKITWDVKTCFFFVVVIVVVFFVMFICFSCKPVRAHSLLSAIY